MHRSAPSPGFGFIVSVAVEAKIYGQRHPPRQQWDVRGIPLIFNKHLEESGTRHPSAPAEPAPAPLPLPERAVAVAGAGR